MTFLNSKNLENDLFQFENDLFKFQNDLFQFEIDLFQFEEKAMGGVCRCLAGPSRHPQGPQGPWSAPWNSKNVPLGSMGPLIFFARAPPARPSSRKKI